nr:MAG TPA: hypothetical protein [Bacteriophage sp.]DAQ57349.1 MAG TPA: hypothetical protein [Bacteriophage sp.]DAT80473.1 MAG TPA: hypothetical protein [Bacteriophage sp.]
MLYGNNIYSFHIFISYKSMILIINIQLLQCLHVYLNSSH